MRRFDQILTKIGELVAEYESGKWMQLERLLEVQRELSSNYYYLTKEQLDYRRQYNQMVYDRGGESVAAAKSRALHQLPEIEISRKIMEAVEKVLISISQEIKILSKE